MFLEISLIPSKTEITPFCIAPFAIIGSAKPAREEWLCGPLLSGAGIV